MKSTSQHAPSAKKATARVDRKRKVAGARQAKSKSKHGGAESKRSETKLYTLDEEILVLGDGDFSFSKGLVAHRGGGARLVATSYDSEAEVKSKYPNAAACIASIRAAKGIVLHDVDATNLARLPARSRLSASQLPPFFQRIVFNFPHTGQQRVHLNRVLLRDFFVSARERLTQAGQVHISLKDRPPYSNWNVEEQAKAAGFVLKARRPFQANAFPGYHHRTTDPTAKAFEAERCLTYVFIVNRTKFPFDPSSAAAFGQGVDEHQDEHQHEPQLEQDAEPSTRKSRRQQSAKIRQDKEALAVPRSSAKTPRSASTRVWRPLHRCHGAWL